MPGRPGGGTAGSRVVAAVRTWRGWFAGSPAGPRGAAGSPVVAGKRPRWESRAAAGLENSGACRRAFYKTRLLRYSPPQHARSVI